MFDSITSSPSATMFCLVVGAIFVLIEATPFLPTFGLAGLAGVGLGVVGIAGVGAQDLPWWPLSIAAVGAIGFQILILMRSRAQVPFAVSTSAVLGGTITTGLMWNDAAAVGVAATTSLLAPAVSWQLIGAVQRIMARPPQIGTEMLVGRIVEVESWSGGVGAVLVDGDRWNARSTEPIVPGTSVRIVSVEGLHLEIANHQQKEKRASSI